ncbi:signal recognition particle-docking protein FtsY [Paracidobacterium acidisoli]|uniref:Signal recognition particle receptor FtsY n=1 Tax=Paracidobacterium acidisoli TaxID=2303751 RepID=A0A372ITK3_9BACT|nr:signal recognition particle-docking protein FtsY [Paracidobacterium acidisoli]MBT9329631.1 signal recognition particle-docking protein FtsY [Paracidobacterium acidisoli]
MIQTLFGSLNEAQEPQKKGFFDRMKQAVSRTRESLGERIEGVIALTREVDEAALEDLEMSLIASDIGVTTAAEIIERLRDRGKRQGIRNGAELKDLLREHLKQILDEQQRPVAKVAAPPEVIMMVGVNGTGKTTTSGKLAAWYRAQAKTVLMCAADTFRAAAIEQLEVWGERSGVEIVRTKQGGDPSAVLFDALQAAKSRHNDVLIVDTAGRLHTKNSLMAELDKMRRTTQRIIPDAPHEVLLVMDATTGQNGLQQARLFTESAGVTGIVLTKLDGTAKGGIAIAIARELKLPVRFVGVGEKIEDILPFDSGAFVDSLLGN